MVDSIRECENHAKTGSKDRGEDSPALIPRTSAGLAGQRAEARFANSKSVCMAGIISQFGILTALMGAEYYGFLKVTSSSHLLPFPHWGKGEKPLSRWERGWG